MPYSKNIILEEYLKVPKSHKMKQCQKSDQKVRGVKNI